QAVAEEREPRDEQPAVVVVVERVAEDDGALADGGRCRRRGLLATTAAGGPGRQHESRGEPERVRDTLHGATICRFGMPVVVVCTEPSPCRYGSRSPRVKRSESIAAMAARSRLRIVPLAGALAAAAVALAVGAAAEGVALD